MSPNVKFSPFERAFLASYDTSRCRLGASIVFSAMMITIITIIMLRLKQENGFFHIASNTVERYMYG